MTEQEWNELSNNNTAAVIAPAGHGKTEMLAEIVERSSGKLLLLTHTNAGVNAIKKRMNNKSISSSRYNVETIASFCIKWCNSYCSTCNIDKSLSPLVKEQANAYYAQFYSGAVTLFSKSWIKTVLRATYSRVIVDEYQDCTLEQHNIMLQICKHLPLIVLGDPMQGIFSFTGPLVDWDNLEYPIIDIKTYPWRWEKTNPQLGIYLSNLREHLRPYLNCANCKIKIPLMKDVCFISPNNFNMYKLLPQIKEYTSVIYVSKWPRKQLEICTHMGGIFQHDENQECIELFEYAEFFDTLKGTKLVLAALNFIKKCSTGVTTELKSYIENLNKDNIDFSRIRKHKDIGERITSVATASNYNSIYNLICIFESSPKFKIYRKELYYEMLRSIKYAIEHNTSVLNGANHIRKDAQLQKRYSQFKFLSSRTLLSKGLEFDCVIIDTTDKLSVKDFYVAMTRAKKKIYIISPTDEICFEDKFCIK